MNELKCPQCGGARLTPSTDGYYKCQYCRIIFKPESKSATADDKPEPPQQQPVVVNVSVPKTEPTVVIQQKSDSGGCVKKGCGILLILVIVYALVVCIVMSAIFG